MFVNTAGVTSLRHCKEHNLELKFEKSKIRYYAFQCDAGYDTPIEKIAPEVKKRGFLTSPDLLSV